MNIDTGVLLGSTSIGSKSVEGRSDNEQLAKEFESLFASMLLKEMRKSLENGGFFEGEQTDSLGGLFDLFIGQAVAEGSPFGIAELIANSYGQSESTESKEEKAQQPSISIKA